VHLSKEEKAKDLASISVQERSRFPGMIKNVFLSFV
jgi:hypothetical protein